MVSSSTAQIAKRAAGWPLACTERRRAGLAGKSLSVAVYSLAFVASGMRMETSMALSPDKMPNDHQSVGGNRHAAGQMAKS